MFLDGLASAGQPAGPPSSRAIDFELGYFTACRLLSPLGLRLRSLEWGDLCESSVACSFPVSLHTDLLLTIQLVCTLYSPKDRQVGVVMVHVLDLYCLQVSTRDLTGK